MHSDAANYTLRNPKERKEERSLCTHGGQQALEHERSSLPLYEKKSPYTDEPTCQVSVALRKHIYMGFPGNSPCYHLLQHMPHAITPTNALFKDSKHLQPSHRSPAHQNSTQLCASFWQKSTGHANAAFTDPVLPDW